MPSFRYRARDPEGKAITGLLEGEDKASVAEQIQRLGYIPVEIELEQKEVKAKKGMGANWADRFMRRVSANEIIYFNRQLALVLGAGVPLLSCLRLMAKQATNDRLRDILIGVSDDIEGGSDLSEALFHYPNVFSPLYVNMIRAGEASGQLESTLNRIAELQEYEFETRERMKAASRYPKLVIGTLIAAFFVVVTFVIPTFAKVFKEFGGELPLPTRIMIALDVFIKQYWAVSLLGIIGLVVAIVWWIRTKPGRYWFDRLKVRVPVFGSLISKFVLSRFSRIFATLNASGLPIMNTLKISTETVGNDYYARSLRRVSEEVLDEVLGKVSDYYNQEVDYAIKRFSTLIEPMLLMVLAAFVLFFALSVFLPLFNLAGVIIQ
jgi:type II secretory pathway component PulF